LIGGLSRKKTLLEGEFDCSLGFLKFQCLNVDRSVVLSALLQCEDQQENSPISASRDGGENPVILFNRWANHA
jgi:hypothetical protein